MPQKLKLVVEVVAIAEHAINPAFEDVSCAARLIPHGKTAIDAAGYSQSLGSGSAPVSKVPLERLLAQERGAIALGLNPNGITENAKLLHR